MLSTAVFLIKWLLPYSGRICYLKNPLGQSLKHRDSNGVSAHLIHLCVADPKLHSLMICIIWEALKPEALKRSQTPDPCIISCDEWLAVTALHCVKGGREAVRIINSIIRVCGLVDLDQLPTAF